MKLWWGYGCLATDLVPLVVTKKSEKNPHNSQKIGLLDGMEFGDGTILVQL